MEVFMTTANLANILGLSLLAAALIAVFFSPYRRWLNFMLAGMVFWGLLEAVRYSVQTAFEWPVTYSYLSALSFAMVFLTLLLWIEDRKAERRIAAAKQDYIEHTPVYEDDHQQYSSRS
jgi:heme A synthase